MTFIFAGIGYSLPLQLFAENYPLNGPVSPEVLNLNFLVAWMGLAHFVFAYYGQAKTLGRTGGQFARVVRSEPAYRGGDPGVVSVMGRAADF